MTKQEAVREAGKALDLLPSEYVCVECGRSERIEWEWARAGEDELDYAIEISPANKLTGWCSYGGDHTFKGRRGLHCPRCHQNRRSE